MSGREVWVDGRRRRLAPRHAIGKGGEADVYEIGPDLVLKLFKAPDHPDLAAAPAEQTAAAQRIAEHQAKLPAFPHGLPDRVVAPIALARDRRGATILGYVMRRVTGAELLCRLGERTYRERGVAGGRVVDAFRDLGATLAALHGAGVVVGDLNDLNIFVEGTRAHLIDADSFQFGGFPCRVFSERFVDPLICDPTASRPRPTAAPDTSTDWYAFAVLLFRSLLLVDPYGGVYRPKSAARRLPHPARPLHRITVFEPEVRYPKAAYRYDILPDSLLAYFDRVFRRDLREPFPLSQLEALHFASCRACGLEHARGRCPACSGAPVPVVHSTVVVRGAVTATEIARVDGRLLSVAFAAGTAAPAYLAHGPRGFEREGGKLVFSGRLEPSFELAIAADRTLVGRAGELLVFRGDELEARHAVDTCDGRPAFATSGSAYVWLENGRLLRAAARGPEHVGEVLRGRTRIFAGAEFGFGFYRAGGVFVAFTFPGRGRGINDGVTLAPIPGHLLAAACAFAGDRCWLSTTSAHGGRSLYRLTVVRADGRIEATFESDIEGWPQRAAAGAAVGRSLLVPTDDGVVQIEVRRGALQVARTFPETEPFVDAASTLHAGADGLYVQRGSTVHRLTLGS